MENVSTFSPNNKTVKNRMIVASPQRKYNYTPLRYPGGKSSLFLFFSEVIEKNNLHNLTYIEPYAGGAGAALALLILGHVDAVVINDKDEAISDFWQSILNYTDEFIEKIERTPITVEEWRRQKAVNRDRSSNSLDRGFSSFYLNRTNRSGILNAGPIGGLAQTGKWLMDARYDKTALINKIRLIASYRGKIEVSNDDGLDVIRKHADRENSFFYIDPPYYNKGQSLYLNAYKPADHTKLATLLNSLPSTKWVLSYDNVAEIKELYYNRNQFNLSLHYQAHSSREGSELIIFSDCLTYPRD